MCTPHLLGRHSSCARYASMVSLIDSEAKGSMRDFVLVKLTDEEFDDFSARHPQGNFQQTSAMGRLRTAQGIDVEYLALKEGCLLYTSPSPRD